MFPTHFSSREIFKWMALRQKMDWKALTVISAELFRRHWPYGFMRTVGRILLGLIIVSLSGSSERIASWSIIGVPKTPYKEIGIASWYGPGFQGKETASGSTFDSNKMTAAHRTLPLGTKVEVVNPKNDKKVEVKITDRGPYVKGRAIDLSRAAAKKLGIVKKGTAKVKIVIKHKKKKSSKKGF